MILLTQPLERSFPTGSAQSFPPVVTRSRRTRAKRSGCGVVVRRETAACGRSTGGSSAEGVLEGKRRVSHRNQQVDNIELAPADSAVSRLFALRTQPSPDRPGKRPLPTAVPRCSLRTVPAVRFTHLRGRPHRRRGEDVSPLPARSSRVRPGLRWLDRIGVRAWKVSHSGGNGRASALGKLRLRSSGFASALRLACPLYRERYARVVSAAMWVISASSDSRARVRTALRARDGVPEGPWPERTPRPGCCRGGSARRPCCRASPNWRPRRPPASPGPSPRGPGQASASRPSSRVSTTPNRGEDSADAERPGADGPERSGPAAEWSSAGNLACEG